MEFKKKRKIKNFFKTFRMHKKKKQINKNLFSNKSGANPENVI